MARATFPPIGFTSFSPTIVILVNVMPETSFSDARQRDEIIQFQPFRLEVLKRPENFFV